MLNPLDRFIEAGNLHAKTIMGDDFVWSGVTYTGTISDLKFDEFFSDDAIGKHRNAERRLEIAKSEFSGALPQVGNTITYDSKTWVLIDIDSEDTTNIAWTIRQQMATPV